MTDLKSASIPRGFAGAALLALAACGVSDGPGAPSPRDFAPDAGFGTQGVLELVATTLGGNIAVANGLALDGSRRLLVAGTVAPATNSGAKRAVFARVLPAGALDATFGISGIFRVDPDPGYRSEGRYAFPVADGRTIVVSQFVDPCLGTADACTLAPSMVAFRRLDGDGRLDAAWGSTHFGPQEVLDAVSLPDDSVVFLTSVFSFDGRNSLALRRMLANGTPDGAFAGRADEALACGESGFDPGHGGRMIRLRDGRLLVSRYSRSPVAGGAPRQCVMRLLEDGSLDAGFGERGYLRFDAPDVGLADTVALLERSDGIVALVANRQLAGGARVAAIAWIRADGSMDSALGKDGTSSPLPVVGFVSAAAIQGDDRIVLAGLPYDPASADIVFPYDYRPRLVRLLRDGTRDAQFGPSADGSVALSVPGTPRWLLPAILAISGDGAIFAAGQSATDLGPYYFGPRNLAIAKYRGRAS